MNGVLEIVRTTLAVEQPLLSVQATAQICLKEIYREYQVYDPWTDNPALRKLHFISTPDLIECLTILAEGK